MTTMTAPTTGTLRLQRWEHPYGGRGRPRPEPRLESEATFQYRLTPTQIVVTGRFAQLGATYPEMRFDREGHRLPMHRAYSSARFVIHPDDLAAIQGK